MIRFAFGSAVLAVVASIILFTAYSRVASVGTPEMGIVEGKSEGSETGSQFTGSEIVRDQELLHTGKRVHRVEAGVQTDAAKSRTVELAGRLPNSNAHTIALNAVRGMANISNQTPVKVHVERTNAGDALIVTFLGPTLANTNVVNYISKVVLDPTNGQVRCIVLPPR